MRTARPRNTGVGRETTTDEFVRDVRADTRPITIPSGPLAVRVYHCPVRGPRSMEETPDTGYRCSVVTTGHRRRVVIDSRRSRRADNDSGTFVYNISRRLITLRFRLYYTYVRGLTYNVFR